jgi:bacteriocin biosynthesis cyclodehydratase domain-containing protein
LLLQQLLLRRTWGGLRGPVVLLPRLAPWYRLVEDGDRLLLEHGRSVVVLEGGAVRTLFPALLPLLDGSRTFEQIVARLGARTAPAVEQALDVLAEHGLLVEGPLPASGAPAAVAVAAAYGIAPAVAAERIGAAKVGVVGGSAVSDQVARLLHADGVGDVRRLAWDEHDVDLAVVVPSPAEAPLVREWNLLALEQGTSWLLLRPFDGLVYALGPLILPQESCCYECLQLRLSAHVEYGVDLALVEGVPIAASAGSGLEAAAAGLVAHLALCWLGGRDTRLPGVLHVLETSPAVSVGTHTVLRVPRCPACSDAERLASPLPWHEAEAA